MDRRSVLKIAGAVSAATAAMFAVPRMAFAAYSDAIFKQKAGADALQNAYGANATTPSDQVKLKAPDIAENGAVVPVTVQTSIPGATSISLLVEKNGVPLAANFNLKGSAQGFVATRIKMQKTSAVIAVVKAGGKAYSARKEVKVTIGGCGG